MNADAYFEIGASHTICEDYALAGEYEDMTYAIVSDGCSSSPDTDLGSRILAHISKEVIIYLYKRKLLYNTEFLQDKFRDIFYELVLNRSMEVKKTLNLFDHTFDATLLVAIGVGKNIRLVLQRGDGFVIFKYKSAPATVFSTEFVSNAPFYLSYEMSMDRRSAYENEYGDSLVYVREQSLEKTEIEDEAYNSEDACTPWIADRYWCFTPSFIDPDDDSDLSQIIISSDGIDTYEQGHGPDRRQFKALEILPICTDYKNPVGAFVQRRMKRVKKENTVGDIIHQDDISFAAINF